MPREFSRLQLLELPDDALLTRREICSLVQISPAALDRAVREERVPAPVAIGPRTIRFRKGTVLGAFKPVPLTGWPSEQAKAATAA